MSLKLKSFRIAVIVSVALCITVACKKSNTGTPVYDPKNVPGTWQVTKAYSDVNNNKNMDANELVPDSISGNKQWIFNANGILTVTYLFGNTNYYYWEFINNNTCIKITDTITVAHKKYIDYIPVQSLTATTMELKDTVDQATGGTNWLFFSKQ